MPVGAKLWPGHGGAGRAECLGMAMGLCPELTVKEERLDTKAAEILGGLRWIPEIAKRRQRWEGRACWSREGWNLNVRLALIPTLVWPLPGCEPWVSVSSSVKWA